MAGAAAVVGAGAAVFGATVGAAVAVGATVVALAFFLVVLVFDTAQAFEFTDTNATAATAVAATIRREKWGARMEPVLHVDTVRFDGPFSVTKDSRLSGVLKVKAVLAIRDIKNVCERFERCGHQAGHPMEYDGIDQLMAGAVRLHGSAQPNVFADIGMVTFVVLVAGHDAFDDGPVNRGVIRFD